MRPYRKGLSHGVAELKRILYYVFFRYDFFRIGKNDFFDEHQITLSFRLSRTESFFSNFKCS